MKSSALKFALIGAACAALAGCSYDSSCATCAAPAARPAPAARASCAAVPAPACARTRPAQAMTYDFGHTKKGITVHGFALQGAGGVTVTILDYGARIQSLYAPDRNGKLADIALGFKDVAGYEDIDQSFGATVGRYANRIAHGRFALDGKTYTLPINNTPNNIGCSLHGGPGGFRDRVWTGKLLDGLKPGEVGVEFAVVSKDGDQGYPGEMKATVRYILTPANVLRMEYTATCTKPCPVNLTNHALFNLKGAAEGTILDHELQIFADHITPVNAGLIPTGALMPIAGTPFDFTRPRVIGQSINDKANQQIVFGNGYDHNWVLRKADGKFTEAAVLSEPTSGRTLEVWTTEPGLQFYAGNFITNGEIGKTAKTLVYRGGLALETQHYPDSPNQPYFPSTILRPGQIYTSVSEYRFGAK